MRTGPQGEQGLRRSGRRHDVKPLPAARFPSLTVTLVLPAVRRPPAPAYRYYQDCNVLRVCECDRVRKWRVVSPPQVRSTSAWRGPLVVCTGKVCTAAGAIRTCTTCTTSDAGWPIGRLGRLGGTLLDAGAGLVQVVQTMTTYIAEGFERAR